MGRIMDMDAGKISSSWERIGSDIILKLEIPENMTATVILEDGYCFGDGASTKLVSTGEYRIKNI